MPHKSASQLNALLDEVIRRREAEAHMVGEHEHYAETAALVDRLRSALSVADAQAEALASLQKLDMKLRRDGGAGLPAEACRIIDGAMPS